MQTRDPCLPWRGEGERVLALESREGTRASRRVEEGLSRSLSGLGREDPLETGMATHSNILAWEIPWMEEPGGLQSMTLRGELRPAGPSGRSEGKAGAAQGPAVSTASSLCSDVEEEEDTPSLS